MISFASEQMRQEYNKQLHPEVVAVISALHDFLKKGILNITEVGRTDNESQRIYTAIADRVLAVTDLNTLSPLDLNTRKQVENLKREEVTKWARNKSSWHKPFAAVDIGLTNLSKDQITEAKKYLFAMCSRPMWELILESHGTGPHFHVGRRDFVWLKNFPGGTKHAPD